LQVQLHNSGDNKDSVVEPVQKAVTGKRLKIDGVIATVGDFIILDSDIDKSF
jgi:peptidyl-prolyl cis-trans isomerase SurA